MIQLNESTFFFSAQLYRVPEFRAPQNSREEWIKYGANDEYPLYLIELYNGSSKHGAICNEVVRRVVGKDFIVSDKATIEERVLLQKKISRINNYGESLHEVNAKLENDRKIFGGFALKVIKTRMGGEMLFHVPYQNVRKHVEQPIYAVAENWVRVQGVQKIGKDDPTFEIMPAYRKGADYSKSLYVYKEYRAGATEYPLPDYVSCIPYIDCDRELGKFNLNNIKNGFLGGMLINFPNGEPTPEQKTQIEKMLKNKFAGAEGDRILIDYSAGKELGVTITPITPPDLANQFSILNEQIGDEIFVGHGFPEILIGRKKDGQLGARNEIIEANELFMNTYGYNRQRVYVDLFNWMFDTEYLEIEQLEPIGREMPESLMSQYLTATEIREFYGFDTAVLEKEPKQPTYAQFSEEEDFSLFNEYGIDAKDANIVDAVDLQFVQVGDTWHPVINERERFASYKFADLSKRKRDILSILEDDPDTDINTIADTLETNAKTILDDIKELQDDGLLNETTPTEKGRAELPKQGIEIRYRYALRSDAPALKSGGESRPFCKALMSAGRLYTREEIDTLSSRYSAQQGRPINVWLMRGGWYRRPKTTRSVPFCRHIWQSVIVKK